MRRKPFYKKHLTDSAVKRALELEGALRKAKESAMQKFPIPENLDQVPNKMYHSVKRILLQEKNTKTRLVEFRKKFEAKWGFSVDRIAHLIKIVTV